MTRRDLYADHDDHVWLDSAAGPVMRPYAVTRGRTHTHSDRFNLLTFITAVPDADPTGAQLLPEHRAILIRASEPVSVAELASHLDLALGVVRFLLGDLVNAGLITTRDSTDGAQQLDTHVLKAVINGLRAL
jgi:DNA-binding transcriptional ArsR family regulator